MTVQIRRASARFVDKMPGRATWHSFSFGSFYDPDRVGFGPMVCHDEHLLGRGEGFTDHPHEGVDIVTYVVSGALSHTDSLGNEGVLEAGELGWLRASTSVRHAEIATAPATRFVQVWLQQYDGEPAWQRVEVASDPDATTLCLPGGDLRVLRLAAGESAVVAGDVMTHLFIASGALQRHSLAEPLAAGDTLLVTPDDANQIGQTGQTGQTGPAENDLQITAATDVVALVWTLRN